MALVEAMASVAALEATVEWLLQSGSELALHLVWEEASALLRGRTVPRSR